MSHRTTASPRGFTLIELLILVAAALVVAGLSVPVLRGIAMATGEESAQETLVRLRDFQVRFRERGVETLGGRARFGTPAELLRAGLTLEDAALREGGAMLERHGYLFQFHFATTSGGFTNNPSDAEVVDAKNGFVVYAWPEVQGRTGSSVFAIDPAGILRPAARGHAILESKNLVHRYGGAKRAPRPFAAAAAPAAASAPTSAPGRVDLRGVGGQDGESWELVVLPSGN